MKYKKVKIYDHSWGTRIFRKINNHPIHVYVNNDASIEVIDGLSSPIAPKVLYYTSVNDLDLSEHFHILNKQIRVKWRGVSRHEVKKCISDLMYKCYKLMVFS